MVHRLWEVIQIYLGVKRKLELILKEGSKQCKMYTSRYICYKLYIYICVFVCENLKIVVHTSKTTGYNLHVYVCVCLWVCK